MESKYAVPDHIYDVFKKAYEKAKNSNRISWDAGLCAVIEELSINPILPTYTEASLVWKQAYGNDPVYKAMEAISIWQSQMFLKPQNDFETECAYQLEGLNHYERSLALQFWELGREFKEKKVKNTEKEK